jgi:uncharacterized protein (DUF2235 family)
VSSSASTSGPSARAPGRPPRRLVVCCDGTWNRSDVKNITNVEKIARTIQTDPASTGGTQQLVEYVAGVGVGYAVDRILGGWLGEGVFANVRAGYRYLALNYQPGDEIFLFGFSRGAYTARSIAGMIGTTGLLTREALVRGYLGEALERYKRRPAQPRGSEFDGPKPFREKCCHATNPISFLGVFDTVGALGVPTGLHTDHQFHDVHLGPSVQVARQALAIDERRRSFAPCLWSVPDGSPTAVDVRQADGTVRAVPRLKQVWFEGVHSDVGGGYDDSGLSDTTLLWMTDQARECGLVFDQALLDLFLDSGRPAKPHSSMNRMYWFANLLETVRPRPEVMKGTFVRGERNLTPTPVPDRPTATEPDPPRMSIPLRLASTARATFDHSDRSRRRNLGTYLSSHTPPVLDTDEEEVVALPRSASPVEQEVVPAAPEPAQG